MPATPHVLIIGAGLAGLACARQLSLVGLSCTILEASDGVGGRVRTDHVDGFQLDRGFQVFLSGYPEAQRTLDYPALKLRAFHPGALVRYGGRFHRISDPFRRPQDLFHTLMSPIGSLRDKLRILRLRWDALHQRVCAPTGGASRRTQQVLQEYGFSPAMLTRFFQPFLGGVFLDEALQAPCWLFEFVWAAFSRGTIALPEQGMGAIAVQLAAALPAGSIRLSATVDHVEGNRVTLESGERLVGDAVVLATDYAAAAKLRGAAPIAMSARHASTLYFDAAMSPVRRPWLIVNGDGSGPVQTFCVLSEVAPTYAPPGRSLIAVNLRSSVATAMGDRRQAVLEQLREWFGAPVNAWRHVRTDEISGALPPLALLHAPHTVGSPRTTSGLYLCGDYCESGTLDGALVSGRKTAEALSATHYT